MEDIDTAIQRAKYNESITVTVDNTDTNTDTENVTDVTDPSFVNTSVVLIATLDKENGGILWQKEEEPNNNNNRASIKDDETDSSSTMDTLLSRHFRTKKWIMPMLHDTKRNEAYELSIEKAVAARVGRSDHASGGAPLRVLDIGSGTSLLAMMTARQFGKVDECEIISLEMDPNMAHLANKITHLNGLQNCISVKNEHSMEFPSNDKFDLITCELLESGVLGEGLLPTLRDVHARHLLKEDGIVLPRRVRVYAQLLGGKDTVGGYRYKQNHTGKQDQFKYQNGVTVDIKPNALLSQKDLIVISDAMLVMELDFTKLEHIPSSEGGRKILPLEIDNEVSQAEGVLFWWSMELYDNVWYNVKDTVKDQDHWQASLYVFPQTITLQIDQAYDIIVIHNDYQISFDIVTHQNETANGTVDVASSFSTNNYLIPPLRALQMNDDSRNQTLSKAIQLALTIKSNSANVLDLSDYGTCANLAIQKGAERVTSLQTNHFITFPQNHTTNNHKFQILQGYAENISTLNLHDQDKVDILLSEPFLNTLQNWEICQALNLHYTLRGLRKRGDVLSPNCIILPSRARIMGCAIHCPLLAKAYSHGGELEGEDFKLRGFSHQPIRRYHRPYNHDMVFPMWQYQHQKVTDDFCLGVLDYQNTGTVIYDPNIWIKSPLFVKKGLVCHAMMIWVEYECGDAGTQLKWSTGTKSHWQSVRMLKERVSLKAGVEALFCCRLVLGDEMSNPLDDYDFQTRVELMHS